jgi:hypothetical protein
MKQVVHLFLQVEQRLLGFRVPYDLCFKVACFVREIFDLLLHAPGGCLQALEAGWKALEVGRSATTAQNPMVLRDDLLRDRVERSR